MLPNPDFFDWLNADQRAAQGLETVLKLLYRRIFNGFKNEEITRADQMTAAIPRFHLLLGLRRQHGNSDRVRDAQV